MPQTYRKFPQNMKPAGNPLAPTKLNLLHTPDPLWSILSQSLQDFAGMAGLLLPSYMYNICAPIWSVLKELPNT